MKKILLLILFISIVSAQVNVQAQSRSENTSDEQIKEHYNKGREFDKTGDYPASIIQYSKCI